MDDYIHRIYFGLTYDYRRLERWLTAMAEQGWRLDGIGTLDIFQFVRDTPGKVRFAVTYAADASPYDSDPTEEELELEALCAETGWKKAASSAQLQIYWNRDPNAVPLETDDLGRVRGIRRAMGKGFFPYQLALMAVFFLQALSRWVAFQQNPADILCAPISLGIMLLMTVLALERGLTTLLALVWLWRAEMAAKKGREIPDMVFYRVTQGIAAAATAGLMVFLIASGHLGLVLWVLVVAAATIGVMAFAAKLSKSRNASRQVNRWVPALAGTMVMVSLLRLAPVPGIYKFEPDAGPISIADLVEDFSVETASKVYVESSSPVLSYSYHMEDPVEHGFRESHLSCQVMDSRFDFALDVCWDKEVRDLAKRDGEVRERTAEVGIPCWSVTGELGSWWLLRFEGRVVALYTGWELTPEQLQRAVEILKP